MSMSYYLSVGRHVACTFNTKADALQRLKYFAPGIRVIIKKGYDPQGAVAQKYPCGHKRNRIVAQQKIVYLKPGEFKLPA